MSYEFLIVQFMLHTLRLHVWDLSSYAGTSPPPKHCSDSMNSPLHSPDSALALVGGNIPPCPLFEAYALPTNKSRYLLQQHNPSLHSMFPQQTKITHHCKPPLPNLELATTTRS